MSSTKSPTPTKKIIVMDNDPSMADLTERHLKALGVAVVDVFLDPNEGYKAIRSGQYHAAIIDWKLNKSSSGLAILSRLRRHPDFVYFPIIISAGSIKKDDLRILQDFQCTRVVEKPLKQRSLQEELISLQTESQWYVANERNIANAFNSASMDGTLAARAIDNALRSAPNFAPLAMIAAKHLLNNNFMNEALNLYNKTLGLDPNFIPALNGKAKIYAKMGRYKDAMEMLKAAQKLSPQNLERLSLMGEIEISLKHPEEAIANFRKALAIDDKDAKSKVGIAVAQGMSRVVAMQVSTASEDMSIAKMINNLGVNMAQNGQYEKAIKYYLMSFAFIGSPDLQTRISFNIGLGFKKWTKLPQARYWLEKSLAISKGEFNKAIRQLKDLQHVVPIAGIGGLPKLAIPEPVPATIKPTVAASPSVSTNEDLSFLDEEVVSGGFSVQGPFGGNASKAFDAMVKDIDGISESDDDFKFDDVI